MSLRERLLALADVTPTARAANRMTERDRELVVAAARMALDEALRECRPPNAYDQEDCATELRALREGLE